MKYQKWAVSNPWFFSFDIVREENSNSQLITENSMVCTSKTDSENYFVSTHHNCDTYDRWQQGYSWYIFCVFVIFLGFWQKKVRQKIKEQRKQWQELTVNVSVIISTAFILVHIIICTAVVPTTSNSCIQNSDKMIYLILLSQTAIRRSVYDI